MKKLVVTIFMLLSCSLLHGFGSTQNYISTSATANYIVTLDGAFLETDDYISLVLCDEEHNNSAAIIGFSLKDGILQSKSIHIPTIVVSNGVSYTVREVLFWGEALKHPRRTNTSEPLELAVEKIILPDSIKELEFDGFERFKNLKTINTPQNFKTSYFHYFDSDYSEDCSKEYKKNIYKQWKMRQGDICGQTTFDNITYNNYKWELKECTGAGNLTDIMGTNNEMADNSTLDRTDTGMNVKETSQKFFSDVNSNIPTNSATNDDVFVVIIANENYRRESKVEYALSDGDVFKEYCLKTIGIPQSNIHHVSDATLNDMRAEIQWIRKVADAYNGEAKIIFYYAGHGIPDESTKSAYLLPADGFGSDVSTCYKLSDLYSTLSNCPSQYTLVLLDACFSGSARSGKMMASARGVALKAKADAPSGNMIVFSAASGDETAYPYKEQHHGMFTYFLLKKLQESNGTVTFGELGDYIEKNVSRRSIVDNSKSQTPTITPSPSLSAKWRNMSF